MVINVISPKKPKGKNWLDCGDINPNFNMGYGGRVWRLRGECPIYVISSVEVTNDPDDISERRGAYYHISISKVGGTRCSSNYAKVVCRAFDMRDSEEDNHVPGGFVRNFWLPVNENMIGSVCPCKETEPAIKEDKGDFVWRGL